MYIYVTLWVIIQHYVTILLEFFWLWELRGPLIWLLCSFDMPHPIGFFWGGHFLTFWYYVSITSLVFSLP